jgi:hypothetical protein
MPKGKASEALMEALSAADIEGAVQRAVSAAMVQLKGELLRVLNEKVIDLETRMKSVETRLDDFVSRDFDTTNAAGVSSTAVDTLSKEIEAVRRDSRQAMLAANDNEQYGRRNNVRIRGLDMNEEEDCRESVLKFFHDKLHLQNLSVDDIDVAHPLPVKKSSHRAGQSQQSQPTLPHIEPTVIVKFMNRKPRDLVIRNRKLLKGTKTTISEDLTSLNMQTMNRVKNNDSVQKTWSWNGKIYAMLLNGRKVTVRPYQPIQELVA